MSSTSSRLGSGGDKYVLKTLCFARKSMAMPSKEEYTMLLTNGLGELFVLCGRNPAKTLKLNYVIEDRHQLI